MGIYAQKQFDKFIGTFRGVSFVDQWDSRVAKVGGKVFALLNSSGKNLKGITFKVEEVSFEMLTELDGVGQASYFAKRKWVTVREGSDLSDADIKAYIERSHALVAKGLTKKLRAELGIELIKE